jgi:hypothetical protein
MERVCLAVALMITVGACHHRNALGPQNLRPAPQGNLDDAQESARSDEAIRAQVLDALAPISTLLPLKVEVIDGVVTVRVASSRDMTHLFDKLSGIDGVAHVVVRDERRSHAAWSRLSPSPRFDTFYEILRSDRFGLHVAAPSAISEIPRHLVFKKDIVTVSDAMNVIARALGNAKYPISTMIELADGLALATPLEQIEANGCAVRPEDRWSLGVVPLNKWTVSGYFPSLINGRQGFYRSFVIAITAQTVSVDSSISPDNVLGTQRRSRLLASAEGKRHILSSSHRVWVLVYEFRKLDTDPAPTPVAPGRMTALEHFRVAGIWEELEKRNAAR